MKRSENKMYKVAVIGFGYWGPNIVRNFLIHPECEVKYISDFNSNARKRAATNYPDIEITDNSDIIFADNEIDIIAIVTPVSTHYALAKMALEAGKHVFIEKPMVQTVVQADDLIRISKEKNLVGCVDHTFLFTSAVMKIKEIVDSGEIGDITYFDSVRVNLGLFQHDVNVMWDLTPHDLAILFHITEQQPNAVTASGVDHLNNGLVDVSYLTLHYNNKMIANFHSNWLSPIKVRKILIGGTKKMIVFDDMEPSEKIKIYDKGIDVKVPEHKYQLLVNYRLGDVLSPNIFPTEALKLEVNNFIDHIKSRSFHCDNDLVHGRNIVKILETADKALKMGKRVSI